MRPWVVAMVPAAAPRLPFAELLLAIALAAFSFVVVRVATEIADPEGALGPLPVIFSPDRGERPQPVDADCRCERLIPVSAPVALTAGERAALDPTEAEAPESPRDRFLGETAVIRERSRTGPRNDLRADLQAATLAIRSLSASRPDMVRPGVGGMPR
jgi:hypothetical protein